MDPTGGHVRRPAGRPAAGGRRPALTVGAALAAVALRIVDPAPVVPSTFGFADLSLVSFGVLGISFASVGALLMVRLPSQCGRLVHGRRRERRTPWRPSPPRRRSRPWPPVRPATANAGLAAWSAVLFSMVGSIIFVLGFIFPTGRGPTPRLGSLPRRLGDRAADRDRRRFPDPAGTASDLPDHRQSVRVRPGPAADLRQAAVADDRGRVGAHRAGGRLVDGRALSPVRRHRPTTAEVVRRQPRSRPSGAWPSRPWCLP